MKSEKKFTPPIPFLLPSLGLTTGILMTEFGAGIISSVLTALFAAGVAIIIFYKKRGDIASKLASKAYRGPFIISLFICIGILAEHLCQPNLAIDRYGPFQKFVKLHIQSVGANGNGEWAIAEIKSVGKTEKDVENGGKRIKNTKVLLTTSGIYLKPGDLIVTHNNLERITDNPNLFNQNHVSSQRRRGVIYRQKLAPRDVKKICNKQTIPTYGAKVRNNLASNIDRSGIKPSTAQLLKSMTIGERDALDPEIKTAFSAAGVAHVLCLSGLHIGLVSALILALLSPLNLCGARKTKWILAIILIWIFICITGLGLPAVRAGIMLTFLLLTYCTERQYEPLNALFAALFFILFFNPSALFQVGFQLSFVCVLTLVGLGETLYWDGRRQHPYLYFTYTALSATLLATFGGWVLISYHFGRIPMYWIAANLVFAAVVPLFMICGTITASLSFFGLGNSPIAHITDFLSETMVSSAQFISKLPMASIEARADYIAVILWMLGLSVLILSIKLKNRNAGMIKWLRLVSVSAFLICVLSIIFPIKGAENEFIIHNNHKHLGFSVSENGSESIYRFELEDGKRVNILGKRIDFALGNSRSKRSKNTLKCPKKPAETDILIVGKGFRGDLSDLLRYYNPRMVITHPAIEPDIDTSLKVQCSKGKMPFHSLKEDGPLRVAAK